MYNPKYKQTFVCQNSLCGSIFWSFNRLCNPLQSKNIYRVLISFYHSILSAFEYCINSQKITLVDFLIIDFLFFATNYPLIFVYSARMIYLQNFSVDFLIYIIIITTERLITRLFTSNINQNLSNNFSPTAHCSGFILVLITAYLNYHLNRRFILQDYKYHWLSVWYYILHTTDFVTRWKRN